MKKILIADDEIAIRLLVHSTLESEEYEIVESRNGPETLEKCWRERPDLLILDIMMPEINGWEVCRKIRSHPKTKTLPIIILTAKEEIPEEEKHSGCPADFYLTKPFSPLELLQCVDEVLKKPDLQ